MELILQTESTLSNTEFLSDRSEKDSKWDKKRGQTQRIESIYADAPANKYKKLSSRLNTCSTLLAFANTVDIDTGECRIKLHRASFCRARHCPVCGWRRSMRNTSRFFSKLPELQEKYPSHRWLFLTLTVPNCAAEDLRATIKSMNAAWARLIKRDIWPASGWVRATEVTRGADGSAHPHFHVMLMVRPSYFSHGYISHEDWLQYWRDAMRDQSITQVDIRAIKPKQKGQTLEAAIVETLKYSTKVEDALMHPSWLYSITDQLKGLRFIASGGVLKGILTDEMSNEEMIVGDETESDEAPKEADLFFSWKRSIQRYSKIS